jgi:hypothetical protein
VLLVASDGSRVKLSEELESADLVVMVASAGESGEAAAIIGAACLARGIMTTGVILTSVHGQDQGASVTLKNLRRYAAMLVVTSDEEYLADMLAALRA